MKLINKSERLVSIDILRGFDMFFLVGATDICRRFFDALGADTLIHLERQFDHIQWEGFTAYDIIMPLFLFTSGLSMPFSFEKFFKQGKSKANLYGKVLKRFCLLFLLGWIAQGHLLDLNINTFHIYCNTLHAIAFGYLITALIILNVKKQQIQLICGMSLVIIYWALMTFVSVPGFGSGIFTPEGNLAIYIDRIVIGRFVDGTQYTWILTSLGFGATVFSGYYAGLILKRSIDKHKKLKQLLVVGIMLIVCGLLWSFQMPIIKKIWSCSMILFSSGICFLLLALSFFLTDIKNYKGWWVTMFRIFGLNAIAAYMLHQTFALDKLSAILLSGLEQFTGTYFPFCIALGEFAILFGIIYHMYKYKIFLKV